MKILSCRHREVYLDLYRSLESEKLHNDERAESMTDSLNWVVSRLWISDSLQEE